MFYVLSHYFPRSKTIDIELSDGLTAEEKYLIKTYKQPFLLGQHDLWIDEAPDFDSAFKIAKLKIKEMEDYYKGYESVY